MNVRIALLAMCAITMVACVKDEVIDTPQGPGSIVGKWNAMEVRVREYEDNRLTFGSTMPYSSFVEDEAVLLDLRTDNSFVMFLDELNSDDDYRDTGIYIHNTADSLLMLRYNGDNDTDTFWHTSFNTSTLSFTVYEDYAWEADRIRLDYKLVR